MVSTRPPTSKSSGLFNNHLVIVPKAPITIGITVTFRFHSFFQFPSKVEVLNLFFTFFQFYSMVRPQLLWGLVFWSRLSDLFVCQSSIGVYVCHSLWQMLGCAYTICSYGQISISCTSTGGSPRPPSRVLSYTPSVLICYIRILCDWWFRHYHNITCIYYFVESYQFSLWYDWFLWRCCVLLLEEILFLF